MLSYFEKVKNFNIQFGVKTHDAPQLKIFESDPDVVSFCMNLIREETKELEQAVSDKNIVEVADAIADSIYVLCGMSARLGINMDEVFEKVHNNNMSKFCPSEEDAKMSVQYYLDHPELGYDSPNYRKSTDDKLWVVYNQSTKKVLKSVSWTPVDLTFLLAEK